MTHEKWRGRFIDSPQQSCPEHEMSNSLISL